MASKRFAKVNSKRCVSCAACVNECPKSAITIYKGCYAVIDQNLCIGCGICERICPAGCIELISREDAK